jgi:hypothetical protein
MSSDRLFRSSKGQKKLEIFDIWKSLIFNNHARGMSVANSPESTTKHHRITQKSRNHPVFQKPGGRDFEAPCAAVNYLVVTQARRAPSSWHRNPHMADLAAFTRS